MLLLLLLDKLHIIKVAEHSFERALAVFLLMLGSACTRMRKTNMVLIQHHFIFSLIKVIGYFLPKNDTLCCRLKLLLEKYVRKVK